MNGSALVVSVKLVRMDSSATTVNTNLDFVRDRAFDLSDYVAGSGDATLGTRAIRPIRA
jgi:hypothetical protein